jgi:hypothetical protein
VLCPVAAEGGIPLTKEEAVVMTEDADTFTVVRRLLLSEIARRKEQSLAPRARLSCDH